MAILAQNLFLAIVTICIIKYTNGHDTIGSCIELVHCNLIQGDIAQEVKEYGNDALKYYKIAEKHFEKHNKFIQTNDESIQKHCESSYKRCYNEVAIMAVEGLKFPSKYRTSCSFRTYSRNIFMCKNIQKWPENILKLIPMEYKDCKIECPITESTILSNGQRLFTLDDGVELTMKEMLPEYTKAGSNLIDYSRRSKNPTRKVLIEIAGFNDKTNHILSPEWGDIDTCPNDSWAGWGGYQPDVSDSLNYPIKHIDLLCFKINKNGLIESNGHLVSATAGLVDRWYKNTYYPRPHLPEGGYHAFYSDRCKTISGSLSYIVGISFHLIKFRTYGNVIRQINYLCGNNPKWLNYGEPDPATVLLCPAGTAICSVQTKRAKYDGVEVLTNVRIGCCAGHSDYSDQFINTEMSIKNEILDFQKQYFLIQTQALNNVIIKYSQYYTVNIIDNQEEWEISMCPPNTFVSTFQVKNPRSSYFNGDRITQLVFSCSSTSATDGTKKTILNMYDRLLQNNNTLYDSYKNDKYECKNGYYYSMEIEYIVDTERPKLVQGWTHGMRCSVNGLMRIDATETNIITENNSIESVVSECEKGKGICGFSNRISFDHSGTLQGLFLKVICCKI